MDKIYIEELEIFANHGVFKEEKKLGQKFLISLELFLDLSEAGKSDNLEKTVHYGLLCEKIEEEFKSKTFDLLEAAAENLAQFILLNYDKIERVKLMIKKPWAPIGKSVKYAAVELDRKWHNTYIAFGSNLGNKKENIYNAIEYINSSTHTKVIKVSSLYETKPVGYENQDNFINGTLQAKTLLSPKELIAFLLDVEKKLKRERTIKWGPRTIDLDVLLYDNLITSFEEIVIPHPRMHERMFVLEPLCEIAPYVIHPILDKRIYELKELLCKIQK
ncbi:2-amino-4-hydroxy-6-hydroxymethyldihydropteridine diphosphokinase [Clostridium sp. SYSU_GA19001]|uniref:2-amino-4-hydroxy-6- hydroxymethyldihydropteridine diphosphokinase n=1 Tax=Clostridium caldaquaticum TaxID=2940653 RepID=UPI00207778A1|nr:2-amino-4-hydroxy-6-hydroxymethyldihydropteridine diphosphokinase [Clostridium caldaquaticum]MCM8710926.1 2-amino-4-hydroxy-6-hydroxymethyldihydropteridine diphosphokinase [Clostridium caldaquaticum]